MTLLKNKQVTTRALNTSRHLALCPQCGDISYKGFWYAADSQFALMIDERKDWITYHECPACEMQNSGSCAGLLHVKHIPESMLGSVFSVIRKAVEQDCDDNPQHRILGIKVAQDGYTLKTTSANMIRRISRRLLDAYEFCEAKSTYQKEPESLRETQITFAISSYFGQSLTNN